MRLFQIAVVCVVVVVGCVAQTHAEVIYQQGDITSPTSGNSEFTVPGVVGYDDFTIGAAATIENASFWALSTVFPNVSNVQWELRNIAPGNTIGSVIASGSASPTITDTGFDWAVSPIYSIYKFDLDIADTQLAAGSYFFGLHVDTPNVYSVFWSYDNDRGVNLTPALQSGGAVYTGSSSSDLQFQLNGSLTQLSTVPEPASLAIWGVGAIGLAVAARRRKQKAA